MKCAKCHQTISPPSSAVAYRSKSYCPACFSALKDQAAKKDKKTSALLNDPDFLDLSFYLCSLFSIQELTPLLRKQLSEYHNERHWSWKSIALAAKYFFELSPHDEIQPISLGILPYVYDEAMSYYRSLYQAQEFNQTVSLEEKTRYFAPSRGCATIESSFRMEDL